jgi:hypothetical protein
LKKLGVNNFGGSADLILVYARYQAELPPGTEKLFTREALRSSLLVGWHNTLKSFVFSTEVIGQTAGVCFSGAGEVPKYGKTEDFNQWKKPSRRAL